MQHPSFMTICSLFFAVGLILASCAPRSAKVESAAKATDSQGDAKTEAAAETKAETAPQAATLTMTDQVVAENVENLTPVAPAAKFEGIDRVFCFTKILGAKQPTHVIHKWFYKDQEVASVKLDVSSAEFRTYSSKWIMQGAMGDWKVKVVDANGASLGDVAFEVAPAKTAQATSK